MKDVIHFRGGTRKRRNIQYYIDLDDAAAEAEMEMQEWIHISTVRSCYLILSFYWMRNLFIYEIIKFLHAFMKWSSSIHLYGMKFPPPLHVYIIKFLLIPHIRNNHIYLTVNYAMIIFPKYYIEFARKIYRGALLSIINISSIHYMFAKLIVKISWTFLEG